MTVRAATISYPDGDDKSCIKIAVTGLANGDETPALPFTQFADRSVQVTGTFGAGGNLRVEGSNDGGTTWAALADPQGVALDITSAKIESILEVVEKVRCRVTAGDGTTSLAVYLILRRSVNPRS